MPWTPLHSLHSIERVSVGVQFSEQLTQKFLGKLAETIDSRRDELRLSSRSDRYVADVLFPDDPASPTINRNSRADGWQFVREDTPGVVIEAFVVTPNGLAFETTQYSRWEQFAGRLLSIGTDALPSLFANVGIKAIALMYFDRFVFRLSDPSMDNFPAPGGIIHSDLCAVLSPGARSGLEPWHVHRGWFDGQGEFRYLVNQNIDAQVVVEAEQNLPSLAFFTKVEKQNPSNELDIVRLQNHLSKMHDLSKKTFQDAIVDDMARKIGLMP